MAAHPKKLNKFEASSSGLYHSYYSDFTIRSFFVGKSSCKSVLSNLKNLTIAEIIFWGGGAKTFQLWKNKIFGQIIWRFLDEWVGSKTHFWNLNTSFVIKCCRHKIKINSVYQLKSTEINLYCRQNYSRCYHSLNLMGKLKHLIIFPYWAFTEI